VVGLGLFKRGESGSAIVGLSQTEPVIDRTGKDDLIYFLVLVMHESTSNDGIQFSLDFSVISMRVKVIVSDRSPFFLVECSERIGDDWQLEEMDLIKDCGGMGLSTFGILNFVDFFDTLIEFFTRFLHNKAS
jgi:hypothetical protein